MLMAVVNFICFAFVALLFTKTVFVGILKFFKYKSLANRLSFIPSDGNDEGFQLFIFVLKVALFVALGIDVSSVIDGTYGTAYNGTSQTLAWMVGSIGVMCLFGALISWHESLSEK